MKRSPTWLALSIVAFSSTVVVYGAAQAGIRVNTSPSSPRGIWIMADDHVFPVHGTYVAVCLPDEWAAFAAARDYTARKGECPGQREALVKRVVAIPGDTVTIDDRGMSVNGQLIPDSKPLETDTQNRPLQGVAQGTYEVRPNQMWVMGFNEAKSFDSRYYGPVPQESIYRTARPWLTF